MTTTAKRSYVSFYKSYIHNGSYLHGHYLACVRTNGTNFLLGVPELAEGYNRVEDRIERRMRNDYMWAEEGDEEIMAIPVSLYASLLNKAEKYDQLIAKMKEVEGEPSRSTGGALTQVTSIAIKYWWRWRPPLVLLPLHKVEVVQRLGGIQVIQPQERKVGVCMKQKKNSYLRN